MSVSQSCDQGKARNDSKVSQGESQEEMNFHEKEDNTIKARV